MMDEPMDLRLFYKSTTQYSLKSNAKKLLPVRHEPDNILED